MDSKAQLKLLPEPKKKIAWKQWAGVVAFIVIVGGAAYVLTHTKPASPAAATTGEEVGALADANAAAPTAKHHFEWTFKTVGANSASGADRTEVTLATDGVAKVIGTYEGPCAIIGGDNAWTLQPSELTGVICYFAGAGDEVGVFYESGQYIVKHGSLDEGSAQVEGYRGSYETLFSI